MAKILNSVLTCPNCSAKVELTMPTDACQFFLTCEQCQANIKPAQVIAASFVHMEA